jgi:hypothetical protein
MEYARRHTAWTQSRRFISNQEGQNVRLVQSEVKCRAAQDGIEASSSRRTVHVCNCDAGYPRGVRVIVHK